MKLSHDRNLNPSRKGYHKNFILILTHLNPYQVHLDPSFRTGSQGHAKSGNDGVMKGMKQPLQSQLSKQYQKNNMYIY